MAEVRPGIPASFESIKTNEKKDDEFRIYNEESSERRVVEHYRDMRVNQTIEFYRRMEEKYSFENGTYRRMMTIEQAFEELEHYIDASDPDLELPNKLHLLQTAEGIRRNGHPDWFQLTGLLHDMVRKRAVCAVYTDQLSFNYFLFSSPLSG
jgi:inositol oxygenase